MTTYSHSGSTGDVFSSLAVVQILGTGEYYLRLNNMDAVAQSIGWPGAGRHSGRMTQRDFDVLEPLMSIQPKVTKFAVWQGEAIDYEFERQARHHNPPGWPRSFSRQYADACGLNIEQYHRELDIQPFLFADKATTVPGRPICVSRNEWYLDGVADPGQVEAWRTWIDYGLEEQAFYVGLEREHAWFCDTLKINIPHVKTEDCLDLARLMQGAEMVIANQSMPGTMAVSMGKSVWIETRKNTPLENNEIYYPYRVNANYF
jgi:hypothetical protein